MVAGKDEKVDPRLRQNRRRVNGVVICESGGAAARVAACFDEEVANLRAATSGDPSDRTRN